MKAKLMKVLFMMLKKKSDGEGLFSLINSFFAS